MSADLSDTSRRMNGAVASLESDFQGLRTGRASTGMLDPISVDAYGSKMPVNQLGNISAPGTAHADHSGLGSIDGCCC